MEKTEASKSSALKFYAVRKSSALNAPALFFDWDDCSVYLDDDGISGEASCFEYKEFPLVKEAVAYLLDHIGPGRSGLGISACTKCPANTTTNPTTTLRRSTRCTVTRSITSTRNGQQQEVTKSKSTECEQQDPNRDPRGRKRKRLATKDASVDQNNDEKNLPTESGVSTKGRKNRKQKETDPDKDSAPKTSFATEQTPGHGRKPMSEEQIRRWEEEFDKHYELLLFYKERFGHVDLRPGSVDLDKDHHELAEKLRKWERKTKVFLRQHHTSSVSVQIKIQMLRDLDFAVSKHGRLVTKDRQKANSVGEEFPLEAGTNCITPPAAGAPKDTPVEPSAEAATTAGLTGQLYMHPDRWASTFDEYFRLLQNYQDNHFSCDVPRKLDEEGYKDLGEWVFQTRKLIEVQEMKGCLDLEIQEKVQRLLQLGFVMNLRRGRKKLTEEEKLALWEDSFQDYYQQLLSYKERFGHLNLQQSDGSAEFKDLRSWALKTKAILRQHTTTTSSAEVQAKVQKLLDIGFSPQGAKRGRKPLEQDWETMFSALQVYKQEHGHCNVPQKPMTPLSRWVVKQKRAYSDLKAGRPSTMTSRQMIRLADLGMTLQLRSNYSWEDRAWQWFEFKAKHGRGPKRYSEDDTLSQWQTLQRARYAQYRAGKPTGMTQEQVDILTEWGFDFKEDRKYMTFDERCEELVEHKRIHGDTNVPRSATGLGHWIRRMKKDYQLFLEGKKSSLSPDKIAKLKAIDFDFSDPTTGDPKMSATTTQQQYGPFPDQGGTGNETFGNHPDVIEQRPVYGNFTGLDQASYALWDRFHPTM